MVIDDDRIIVSSKSYSAVDGLRAAAEKGTARKCKGDTNVRY